MVSDTRISNLAALAACDAIVDRVDLLSVQAAGRCEIRSGAPPAEVETADSGTLLTSIDLNQPAFDAAADQAPGAQAALDVTPVPSNTSATAAGTAGHYRIKDRATTPVPIWQNTCGGLASGEGMELSNVNIALGQAVSITAGTMDVPET